MNKLFLRILVGLVTAFSVLGLFSYTLISLSSQVRHEHYWSEKAQPVMRFIAGHQTLLSQQVPSFLTIATRNNVQFSSVVQARLNAEQVVLLQDEERRQFVTALNNDFVLSLETTPTGRELFELYAWVARQVLTHAEAEQSATVPALQQALNAGIRKVSSDREHESQLALNYLVDQGYYAFVDDGRHLVLWRDDNGQIFELDLGQEHNSVSLPVLVLVLLIDLLTLALLGFYVIQGLDRRLRNIETVASRIARGELEARVKRAGNDDAVSRLGLAFNSMADHIQRLMYVQKEMIHAVSHELRTPVARIRFGVQMIEDCPNEKALQKQLKGIDGDIQELDELIDEILTYARLEQGGPILAFQEADIKAIVDQVVSEQGSVKPEMEIFAEFKDGSDLWKISEVEARYIHRSIQNLVGNATRYAKGKVRVNCSFDQETCRIDVEDDGPGIPEEQWESVFTPFARLDDSRTRSSGGYGLGLSIVRRILYWHGGQAFLGRSEMGGAKFSLVWPRKQPQ